MTEPVYRPRNHAFCENECLYQEGTPLASLSILVQGRLGFFVCPAGSGGKTQPCLPGTAYRLFEIDRNVFVGAADLVTGGVSGCTCAGLTTGTVLQYPLPTEADFWTLVRTQKDYGAFILQSLGFMLEKTRAASAHLRAHAEALRIRTENLGIHFWALKSLSGFKHHPANAFFSATLEQWEALQAAGQTASPRLDPVFLAADHGELLFEEIPADADEDLSDPAAYAIRLNRIPLETRKLFFGSDAGITARHIRESAQALNDSLAVCRDILKQGEAMLARLYLETGDSLHQAFHTAALEMAAMGQDPAPAVTALDEILSFLQRVTRATEETYGHTTSIDMTYLAHAREQLLIRLRGEDGTAGDAGMTAARQALPDSLRDSAATLIAYAELPVAEADHLLTALTAFRNLDDRFSSDPDARAIRENLVAPFRALYAGVLRKSLTDREPPRLVHMLLRFGFVDEWLLTPEQTLELYRLAATNAAENPVTPPGHSGAPTDGLMPAVWYLPDWLDSIHRNKTLPSRNTFDMDYQDTFRDLKRKGKLSDRDKAAYEANADAKLDFELDIMLQTNQKNCYGKPGIFSPVLHEHMIVRDPALSEITRERIHEAVSGVLAIDPTAFHREVHFQDPRHIIEKERIHHPAAPDIILLPTFGSRGMMWQEISGRSRVTPGRFLLPAFSDEPLDTLMIRLIGNFRWELCRTLMGTGWNDITQPSLTSEYADYIQFYKTNKDLSDDAKARVKTQIAKYRGNTRDMFTADYEVWIRNEFRGNLRLNKVVRKIFFKYCPFSHDMRRRLERHPAYADLIRIFEARQAKEAQSLASRYARYRDASGKLHPDLEENLRVFTGV